MNDARITLRFDGGSRGNPGPAAVGVVLEADDGTPVCALGRPIGVATNNVAEYRALIVGLEEAKKLGVRNLRVIGDSELVIKQMLGEYRVKNETLRPLFLEAQRLLQNFPFVEIAHNLRGHNELADALANLAMDKKRDVTDADLPAGGVSGSAPKPSAVVLTCPKCGTQLKLVRDGKHFPGARPFTCRCGTAMDV